MKHTYKTIAIGTLALLGSCKNIANYDDQTRDLDNNQRIYRADLIVHRTTENGSVVMRYIYLDHDGDSEVDQRMIRRIISDTHLHQELTISDLVREGSERRWPIHFHGDPKDPERRKMTSEEAKQIDSEYSRLIR